MLHTTLWGDHQNVNSLLWPLVVFERVYCYQIHTRRAWQQFLCTVATSVSYFILDDFRYAPLCSHLITHWQASTESLVACHEHPIIVISDWEFINFIILITSIIKMSSKSLDINTYHLYPCRYFMYNSHLTDNCFGMCHTWTQRIWLYERCAAGKGRM